MVSPDDYLLMSGIQHFSFCRRQWALIHLEQQWSENQRTAEAVRFAISFVFFIFGQKHGADERRQRDGQDNADAA